MGKINDITGKGESKGYKQSSSLWEDDSNVTYKLPEKKEKETFKDKIMESTFIMPILCYLFYMALIMGALNIGIRVIYFLKEYFFG